jgi:hypothetical protein
MPKAYSSDDDRKLPARPNADTLAVKDCKSLKKSHSAQRQSSSADFKLLCKEPLRKHSPTTLSSNNDSYDSKHHASRKSHPAQPPVSMFPLLYPYASYGGFISPPLPPAPHHPQLPYYLYPPAAHFHQGHNSHYYCPPGSFPGFSAPTGGPTYYSSTSSAGYPPLFHGSSNTVPSYASQEEEKHSDGSDSSETRRLKRREARKRKRTQSQDKHRRHSY